MASTKNRAWVFTRVRSFDRKAFVYRRPTLLHLSPLASGHTPALNAGDEVCG